MRNSNIAANHCRGLGLEVVICALFFFALATPRAAWAQAATANNGIDTVEVLKATATVEKIDLEKRKVTLLLDNGKHKTFKVDKSVQNLDQVKVGDHLKIKFTEEVLVVVGNSQQSPSAADIGEVAVAPKGAKPGVYKTETYAMTAKVIAIDTAKHRVTLEDPDGKRQTIKLGKKATNADQLKVGETIGTVITDSLVIDVLK